MICPEFEKLTHQERISFIGKLVHGVQNSNRLFKFAQVLISAGEEDGVFDNVVINPPQNNNDNEQR